MIRMRFDDSGIERMLRVSWWRFPFADLHVRDPASFRDDLEEKIAAGSIRPFEPGRPRMAGILERSWPELRTGPSQLDAPLRRRAGLAQLVEQPPCKR